MRSAPRADVTISPLSRTSLKRVRWSCREGWPIRPRASGCLCARASRSQAMVRSPRRRSIWPGFIMIECASMDRAVERAARIPEATLGLVEVRPLVAPPDVVET